MKISVLGSKGYERTLTEIKELLQRGLQQRAVGVSASAFSQARRKLTPALCAEAFVELRGRCVNARLHPQVSYGDFILAAMDGTKLSLPARDVFKQRFGCPKQAPDGPQASFTVLWDVGANQPIAWRLGRLRTCERSHALSMITGDPVVGEADEHQTPIPADLGPKHLVLADRNFASRRLMWQLKQSRAQWLMRVRSSGTGTLQEVVDFVHRGLDDETVSIVERDHRGRARVGGCVLQVRLIRKALADGEIAVFITSLLDREEHPADRLLDLYLNRWRVETAFRELKIWHGLQSFHARYADGIAQEIAAVMIFQLIASELEAQARIRQPEAAPVLQATDEKATELRVPVIRFNRMTLADCVARLLCAALSSMRAVHDEFDLSMARLWRGRQRIDPERRSFPRKRKSAAKGFKYRGLTGRGRKPKPPDTLPGKEGQA